MHMWVSGFPFGSQNAVGVFMLLNHSPSGRYLFLSETPGIQMKRSIEELSGTSGAGRLIISFTLGWLLIHGVRQLIA